MDRENRENMEDTHLRILRVTDDLRVIQKELNCAAMQAPTDPELMEALAVPPEMESIQALKSALDAAQNTGDGPFRRTLAGAVVTLKGHQLIVERAPPRGRNRLTKRGRGRASHAKTR